MKQEAVDTSYEAFSREPEYVQVNELFIKGLGLGGEQRVLELGCGPGTLMKLILELTKGAWISGLDISPQGLSLARRSLAECGLVAGLIEASADNLPLSGMLIDTVVMGNAIQLVGDKDALFREVHRVLRPGGTFAFNTSFYAGTFVPRTERFYVQWVAEASNFIKRRSDELKVQGLPSITRKRGLGNRAFSRPWLSIQEYESTLRRHGFAIKGVVERTVTLTKR